MYGFSSYGMSSGQEGGALLREALDERSVAVGVEAKGWREAVEGCGRLLVVSGAVEERYVRAMVRTTEELGPYAVIAPGVAIPHARPEDGARAVGLSLAVLGVPVEFGSKENEPVDLVFGFSTIDAEAHVDLIRALADFIERPENTEALRGAGTVEEVLEIVERSERDA
jgi:mannitol/fructose-specific phosphotransferase system IIA component (Ntr-type)